MGLEHLKEIEDALDSCGAEEYKDISEHTRVADVLADSAELIQLFEKLNVPVKHYISGGGLNQEGVERIRIIGDLNGDSERAEKLINSKDLYGTLTVLDIDRVIGYERIASIN